MDEYGILCLENFTKCKSYFWENTSSDKQGH